MSLQSWYHGVAIRVKDDSSADVVEIDGDIRVLELIGWMVFVGALYYIRRGQSMRCEHG